MCPALCVRELWIRTERIGVSAAAALQGRRRLAGPGGAAPQPDVCGAAGHKQCQAHLQREAEMSELLWLQKGEPSERLRLVQTCEQLLSFSIQTSTCSSASMAASSFPSRLCAGFTEGRLSLNE